MSTVDEELPIGFEMALAKNFCAMKYVSGLSEKKRQKVIEKARTITSAEGMRDYVTMLGDCLKC